MSGAGGFSFKALIKAKELHKRLLFTGAILMVYRLASFIPLPGIDIEQLASVKAKISGSFFGMFDVFSGGSLSRMTIMALNIAPYISSSILFQLLGSVSPYFANLKKEGESGKAKLTKYTRYGALVLSVIQGYGLATALELMKDTSEIVMFPGFEFRFIACLVFCCSTMMVMWFGEQITSRGIGNGSSIIIYTGIVANLPSSIVRLFELGKNGEVAIFKLFVVCALILFLFTLIVFIERIERPVEVHYTRKQISSTMMLDARTSFLPIKLNPAGVLPPIFASTILTVPAALLGILGFGKFEWGRYILSNLAHGSWIYTLSYAILIFSVSSIYASLFFDCKSTADNLNKSAGFIKGIRPGQKTSEYLEALLLKISTIGGLYLMLICVIPEIMMSQSLVSLYFSGTSFIIVVGVALDFIERVRTTILAYRYEKLFKKGYGGLM
jgi:preprotein translocase subunit SecY